MKIGILGGTGKLGLAMAQRCRHAGHEVVIGSRDVSKAAEAAQKLGGGVLGSTNADAAVQSDAVFVSVPYGGHRALLEPLKSQLRGKIIIDATVPLDPGNLLQIKTDSGKSAAEETAAMIEGADVFAGFHTVSHRSLRELDVPHDVLVAGGAHRKADVMVLVRSLGLNPIDTGPIEIARHLERMTALLISINKANKVKESGIKITGI
jgi:hypothetical protein